MATTFDVIIVGLGAMGSSAAYRLARQGVSVLGLDRHTPPHAFGSSHGRSRIIREAYFEHPSYVPLVQRAYELWAELEQASGRELLRKTGGLMIGHPDGTVVAGARHSAELHRLAHDVLSAAEARTRFPQFQLDADMVAVWEPRAGVLFPEACIEAHLSLAVTHGAELRYGTAVTSWRSEGNAVSVRTAHGEFRARRLLLTAGAWVGELVPELKHVFSIERQVLYWFAQRDAATSYFAPERCPVHLWEPASRRYFYGFPDFGDGVKIALHHAGEAADPERLRRDVGAEEIAGMRELLRRHLPGADGALLSSEVCMYTNTPDEHFWIDHHPQHGNVLVASPCSGHGFKFASVIGDVLAELLMGATPRFDLSLFRQRAF